MQRKSGDRASRETRRTFLKSTGALAAGASWMGAVSRPAHAESLAVSGGAKAVTCPEKDHRDAYRWPLYGEEEQKALLQLAASPGYGPLALFEKDWKKYTGSPYVTNFCNGTSALTSMFFALNLPPGSEIMVPSYPKLRS